MPAKKFTAYSSCQYILADGDRNTSTIQISGRLRIDWNRYIEGVGLLECLNFGKLDSSPTVCNVPDPDLITLAGEI